MSIYIVSYDLIKIKDYKKLQQAIESADDWCKPLLSLYIIKSNYTAIEIRDKLRPFVDNDDKFLVSKLTSLKDESSYGLDKDTIKWINANL